MTVSLLPQGPRVLFRHQAHFKEQPLCCYFKEEWIPLTNLLWLESRLQSIFTAPLGEKLLTPLIATSQSVAGLEWYSVARQLH